jgi:GT2 family glycosyltransferase
MSKPLRFSVIVPAYRAAAFMERCLGDVAAQTWADWEVIVVEDGSDDGTRGIVEAFAGRHPGKVHYRRLEQNRGVSVARNTAIGLASGDWLAFLDADDRWRPEHLESVAALALDGWRGLVVARFEIRWPDGRVETGPDAPRDGSDLVQALIESSFIQTSSAVAMPRELWDRAGPFDSELRIGEDLDVWLRAIRERGLARTPGITCVYARQPGSTMSEPLRAARDRVAFLEKQIRIETTDTKWLRGRLVDACIVQARMLRRCRPAEAHAAARSALAHAPLDPRVWFWCLATLPGSGGGAG